MTERDAYQALLRSEWSKETLVQALDLLDSLAGPDLSRGGAMYGDSKLFLEHRPRKQWEALWPRWRDFFSAIVDPLNPSLPDLPADLPLRKEPEQVETVGLALRSLTRLLFPRFPWVLPHGSSPEVVIFQQRSSTWISGQGLFRDVQSVAFQTCVLFVEPEMEALGLTPERALLLHGLNAHALLFWQHDPAHQQFLLGLFHDACGQREASLEALRTAFARTHPVDHDYLTKAQLYWSRLRDAGRLREAEEFVLGLYRSAPQEHLAEIRQLIGETFQAVDAA